MQINDESWCRGKGRLFPLIHKGRNAGNKHQYFDFISEGRTNLITQTSKVMPVRMNYWPVSWQFYALGVWEIIVHFRRSINFCLAGWLLRKVQLTDLGNVSSRWPEKLYRNVFCKKVFQGFSSKAY